MNGAADITPAVTERDRFQAGMLLALLLHGILVFGIGFGWQKSVQRENALEFRLAVPNDTEIEIDSPELLAQSAQLGSGGSESSAEQLTRTINIDADSSSRETQPGLTAEDAKLAEAGEQLLATRSPTTETVDPRSPNPELAASQRLQQIQSQKAELLARLSDREQEIQSRDREIVLSDSQLAAAESAEASYQVHLQQRIESVGTDNFPVEVLENRLFGSLNAVMTVRADGSVERVEILRSSGYPLLDQAALDIARRAAPFDPFPAELARDYDRIHFTRVWRFSAAGSVETSAR